MRIRSKFIRFLTLVACVNLTLSLSYGLAADLFPSIEIPVFHSGHHIKKEIDPSRATKSISYRVHTKFPAAEVLEFYDSYFNARGWRSSFEICQRHWDRLTDGTKAGGPSGEQLFTSWEHPKFNLKAILRLEYERVNEKWQDELVVRCQLQPKPALLTSPKARPKPQKAPVMLAQRWDPKIDIKGWWLSEKLDGVRGYWTGKEMISRSGNPFHVPAWFTKNFPATPLDGELWIGRRKFSELVGTIRRKLPDAGWEKVRYLIFDAPQAEGGFEKRLDFARRWFQQHPNPYSEVLKQQICENEMQLRRKLAEVEALGGEGMMLRKPNSAYTVGRSYDLLKVKTFEDEEATVINHLPGSGKHAGRLGALQVELPSGIQFAIGTGFTDQERENPPPVGSIITFKYYGFHESGIPRFASFLRVREAF
jgi:DNA ligase 1